MLQYAVWIGIYVLSMKFMKDYAGRNSPLWGGGFIIVSSFMTFISTVIIAIILPGFLKNILIFQVSTLGLSFILTVCVAFIVSKILKKKDIRARKKTTSVNYRLIAIIIFIIGGGLLTFDTITSGKLNYVLLFIVMLGISSSLKTYNISRSNNTVALSKLNSNRYVLLLRSFNSKNMLSKPNKKFSLYENWKRIFGWKVNLVETLERTELLTIDTYLGLIFKSKNIPFVALGDPEDYLPSPGSLKVYTDDDLWKEEVVKYIAQAGKILLIEGVSEGLLWELKYIRKNVQPAKVLVMTYPDCFTNNKRYIKKSNYKEFSDKLNSLGYCIPQSYVGSGVIFEFDQKWNARELGQGAEFMAKFNYFTMPKSNK